jgi:hypothetical protein
MTQSTLQESSFASPQRVLVVNRGSLLDEGVFSLIRSKSNLDVSIINFESEDTLVNDIVSRHPEVVVMGQSGSVGIENLYKMITSFSTMKKLRMIIFHSNDNLVDVFPREKLNSYSSGDFMTLVQGAQVI